MAQFASLDAATMFGAEREYAPNPSNIARRSISIFSRRGTEIPEPSSPSIAQETTMHAPRPMTEKQKSWIGRRRSVCGSPRSPMASSPKSKGSPKTYKGTILNAVPQAKLIKMTALEEEMATSPNEEIVSAISDHTPTMGQLPSPPQSPPSHQGAVWYKATAPLALRSNSCRQHDTNTRIGVWVDGVVHWDQEALERRPETIEEAIGFTPVRLDLGDRDARRPQLSVVIPGHQLQASDRTYPAVLLPGPKRAIVPVIPPRAVSRFAAPPVALTHTPPSKTESGRPVDVPMLTSAPVQTEEKEFRASRSSTSSSSCADDTSDYSKRSSATSVELVELSKVRASKFCVMAPDRAGVFDGDAVVRGDVNKPLPPPPIPGLARVGSSPALHALRTYERNVRASQSMRTGPGNDMLSPAKLLRQSRSMSQLDHFDDAFIRSSPYPLNVNATSPTLSQAEQELHAELSSGPRTATKEDAAADDTDNALSFRSAVGSLHRSDSVRSVMQPPERAPTIPRRSRKRDWRASRQLYAARIDDFQSLGRHKSASQAKTVDHSETGSHVRKVSSMAQIHSRPSSAEPEVANDSVVVLEVPQIVIDDGLIVVHGPVIAHMWNGEAAAAVSTASAEEVLLNILSSLDNTNDLFSTAVINKGMYRIFKENEMHLLRIVAHNQSPAAWEFREWCPPDRNEHRLSKETSQLEHTPISYMCCQRRDQSVVESLKRLILDKCKTSIRRETCFALSTPNHEHAQRFEDALWRIWCFCKIFGCDKGREDDITGQLDWLRGGLLANNQGFSATVNTNLDFEMSSVLMNAPEHFAKGNPDGLTAPQLFDMTEIWTSMISLLQGYLGRVDQARRYGVFDGMEVAEGDMEKEEHMLEEWTAYLLTLGPAVVLEMAEIATDSSGVGFALAKENGWTQWTPWYNGSRNSFLKEPVARTYEERVATANQRLQDPREMEKKEMSRKRVATLAAEIRLRRQSSAYKRLPLIDMHSERPMSMVSRRNSVASYRSVATSQLRTPTVASPNSPAISPSSFHTARFALSPPPVSPNSLWGSTRKISPIIENRVEEFNRMSFQNFAGGIAEDTSTRAVARIVGMGFTEAQASEALRTTDMGDGLRVDRAIEFLLRQRK